LDRKRLPERVARRLHFESFRSRWLEPTVLYVVDAGDAWSAYLKRMLAAHEMTVTALARKAGLHRTTVSDWLHKGAGAITIQSVYLIADALGEDRETALRAAGDIPRGRDPEVDLILAAPRTDEQKAEMIQRLMRRREEEERRRIEDLRFALGVDEAAG